MMTESKRGSFLGWVLGGISALLILGTVLLVAVPVFRCPGCAVVVINDGGPPRRVRHLRFYGEWEPSNAPCGCCDGRTRVTALGWWLNRHGHQN